MDNFLSSTEGRHFTSGQFFVRQRRATAVPRLIFFPPLNKYIGTKIKLSYQKIQNIFFELLIVLKIQADWFNQIKLISNWINNQHYFSYELKSLGKKTPIMLSFWPLFLFPFIVLDAQKIQGKISRSMYFMYFLSCVPLFVIKISKYGALIFGQDFSEIRQDGNEKILAWIWLITSFPLPSTPSSDGLSLRP